MPDAAILDDGATKVGVAWVMKEFLAFFVKWKKSAEDESPSDSWKDYCREQFATIKDDLRAMKQKVETLDDKVQDLKIDIRNSGGKD